ncbi:DUF1800 domain-containing protein [Myxococcus sp. CA040A]|uniref:DUF1800 domain-containing protein n=1 Tax=Myxococcus sp. CA040A TaxID=2741738 RepID=UPI00157B67BC|nr:DUF1800 domain-containing protein [Myxococcus sp. CA040A]NTX03384.1 DUF1800 domain-containing protein [Myxococcus sp. CA040A]
MRLVFLCSLVAVLLSCASTPHPVRGEAPLDLGPGAEVHLLQRWAFGPSERDLAEVRALGVRGWVEARLARRDAPMSPVLEAKLRELPTLTMSMTQLVSDYPGKREREQALLDGRELLPTARIGLELSAAKVLRAVEGPNPLEEVLVDFWFNHFNVSANKGAVRWMVTSYERDAIRPHVLGRFRDLLGATARHPAMLVYLDNWTSTRDGLPKLGERLARRGVAPMMMEEDGDGDDEPAVSGPRPGLNENYARELLELHTLGVDGGYSQQDVREVARSFTGWSIRHPRRAPEFLFRRRAHDREAKQVLGQVIPARGGEADGEKVLDLLARHPATARHVAMKLARRFVSDTPPPALVDRLAKVFLDSDGDLPTVYRALIDSPEFWAPEARGAKVKTPFEFVVSALRATRAQVEVRPRLVQALARMGEPLYRAPAPTGFPEGAAPWVNSGALVARLNFSLDLVSGRLPGARVTLSSLATPATPTAEAWVDTLGHTLLGTAPSAETRATVLAALSRRTEAASAEGEPGPVDVQLIAGLLLGSPEFQRQ